MAAPRKPVKAPATPVRNKPAPAALIDAPAAPVSVAPAAVMDEVVEAVVAETTELRENLAIAAESVATRTRKTLAEVEVEAGKAAESLEASLAAATGGLRDINAFMIASFKANADAGLDLVRSLMGVRSVPEALTLQSDFARKQLETMSAQARDFVALAQKVSLASAAPLKAGIARNFHPAA